MQEKEALGLSERLSPFAQPIGAGAGSNGRCNTIWYKAAFKGGEARRTVSLGPEKPQAKEHSDDALFSLPASHAQIIRKADKSFKRQLSRSLHPGILRLNAKEGGDDKRPKF